MINKQEQPPQDKPMLKVFIDNIHSELSCMDDVLSQIEYRVGVIDGRNEPKCQPENKKEPQCVHDHLSLISDRVRNANQNLIDINDRLAKQVG